jgi:hypothetical protein
VVYCWTSNKIDYSLIFLEENMGVSNEVSKTTLPFFLLSILLKVEHAI